MDYFYIEPVRGYSRTERKEKIKEIEESSKKLENISHKTSFGDLLDQAIEAQRPKEDDSAFIVDINSLKK